MINQNVSFIRTNGSFSIENINTLSNSNNCSNNRLNNNKYKLISDLIISCIGDIKRRPKIDDVIEKLYYIKNIVRNNEK